MSSELTVYRKARPWGFPQPVPTIIVANEVAGQLIEKDVGLHRVHKTPGSFAVYRAAGEPAILLGRDGTQPRGVQEVSEETDALARIVIDGSGAVGIACFSQRGLWVRGVVPVTLMEGDSPPVAVS